MIGLNFFLLVFVVSWKEKRIPDVHNAKSLPKQQNAPEKSFGVDRRLFPPLTN